MLVTSGQFNTKTQVGSYPRGVGSPSRPQAISHSAVANTQTLLHRPRTGLSCLGAAAVPSSRPSSEQDRGSPARRGVPRGGTASLAARHTLLEVVSRSEHQTHGCGRRHPARALHRRVSRAWRARTARPGAAD